MIKTIIFDLGGVLLKHDEKYVGKQLAKHSRYGANFIASYFQRGTFFEDSQIGKIKGKAIYSRIINDLELTNVDSKKIDRIIKGHFSNITLTQALAKKLSKDYELMLLSNISDYHFKIANTYSILNLFEKKILSFEEKAVKPTAKIYQKALKLSDSKPEEMVFIDDKRSNALGAKVLGIHPIHYKNNTTLVQELTKLGVKC